MSRVGRVLRALTTSLDTVELAIPIVFGTALFLGLAAVPLLVAVELFQAERPGSGTLALALFVTPPALLVRDFRRQQTGWFSAVIAVVWLACVVYAAVKLLF